MSIEVLQPSVDVHKDDAAWYRKAVQYFTQDGDDRSAVVCCCEDGVDDASEAKLFSSSAQEPGFIVQVVKKYVWKGLSSQEGEEFVRSVSVVSRLSALLVEQRRNGSQQRKSVVNTANPKVNMDGVIVWWGGEVIRSSNGLHDDIEVSTVVDCCRSFTLRIWLIKYNHCLSLTAKNAIKGRCPKDK